eukprot:UN24534
MRDVLKMPRNDWEIFYHSEHGNDIKLKHLFCIWQYLLKQVAYDDPKRMAAPEDTLQIYKKELTPELTSELKSYVKSLTLGELEELVFKWYDVLKTMGSDKREDLSLLWKIWMVNTDLTQTSMLNHMPHITLDTCGSAYEFMAKKF